MGLFAVCLLFTVFVLGGGVFMHANIGKPWLIPMGTDPNTGNAIIIYPGLDRQLIIEGFVIMLFLLFGFTGALVLYDSHEQAYTRNYALKILFIGVFMIVFCFVGVWWIFTIKV